ncbi:hypothetical protein [Burkholderia sp. NLJ2]|uniref:hypothetical protein n=1 Tax=Burkholderia sp. NLJ2 TaxID=3090699 RepID=UPI003C6CBF7B
MKTTIAATSPGCVPRPARHGTAHHGIPHFQCVKQSFTHEPVSQDKSTDLPESISWSRQLKWQFAWLAAKTR